MEGLDATIIGPYDLTSSMGLTGELDHPDVIKAFKKVLHLSKKKGVPTGMHVVVADETKLKETVEAGYGFIAYSVDGVYLTSIARNL